jgi:peptidoglycan hydrolase CwlO-like protein
MKKIFCASLVGAMIVFISVSGCTQKLKQENAKLTAQVNDLNGQVQACQAEKGKIAAEATNLKQQVSTLTQEKADLQKKVDSLSKKPAGKKK